MSVLACRDLRVERSGFVLRVPSLELDAGTTTLVCGPNGSGKSTLLFACAGLLDVAGGLVELDGHPFHDGKAPARAGPRKRVVLVPQDPYLFRGTVQRNLSWGLRLRGVPRLERRRAVDDALAALGLDDFATANVAKLSGGQRTLVAVARALALRPRALLLDEVTRDLDTDRRRAVARAIEGITRMGAVVLVATHDTFMVEQFPERVVLRDGRMVELRSSA